MANWYCTTGGQQVGPTSLESLQQMAQSGILQPGDLVWQEGMPQWVPAGTVPALFAAQMPPPASPAGYAQPYYPQAGYGRPNAGGVKVRHGCLTAWLILMIIANSLVALGMLVMAQGSAPAGSPLQNMPASLLAILAIGAVCNLVFAIALFQWKKWAFYGFCVTSAIAFCINVYAGVGIGQSVLGLAGFAILYGLLQMGSPSGWQQLD